MQRLSDDELFDVLDGAATKEVAQRHQYWLEADASYREYFTELLQMHNDLGTLSIEVPSMAFENKVMHQWALAQTPVKHPVLIKWMPFLFIAIMLLLTAGCVFIIGGSTSSVPGTEQLQRFTFNVNVPIIQQVLLPLNAVLFLLVCERILRRKLREHH